MVYVADISDQFILGLYFLRENNFKLDFKNNDLHSSSEDIAVLKRKCEDIKPVHQVTAKCETTMFPRTEIIVPGIINEEKIFRYRLIEYPSTDNSFKGVLMSSSLLDLLKM